MSEIKRYKQSTTTTPIMEESAGGLYCLYSEVEALLKEKEKEIAELKEAGKAVYEAMEIATEAHNKLEEQLTKHRELMDEMSATLENCRTTFSGLMIGPTNTVRLQISQCLYQYQNLKK